MKQGWHLTLTYGRLQTRSKVEIKSIRPYRGRTLVGIGHPRGGGDASVPSCCNNELLIERPDEIKSHSTDVCVQEDLGGKWIFQNRKLLPVE